MQSMTGFGRGTASADGNQVTIEISAVNNRKQADIRVCMPRELAALETPIRKRIQETVSRGCLTVTLSYEANAEMRQQKVRLDVDLAAGLVQALRELAASTGIEPDVRVGELLAVPGIVCEHNMAPTATLAALAIEALDAAIADMRRMQAVEGQALRQDLLERATRLRQFVAEIAEHADDVLGVWQRRLLERARMLGQELAVDDERLAKEVAFYAERSDITEELVRLDSHLAQFLELLDAQEPVGRALEFLCQEMNRETTTIGAKTGDSRCATRALALKTELGRVREQILNVE